MVGHGGKDTRAEGDTGTGAVVFVRQSGCMNRLGEAVESGNWLRPMIHASIQLAPVCVCRAFWRFFFPSSPHLSPQTHALLRQALRQTKTGGRWGARGNRKHFDRRRRSRRCNCLTVYSTLSVNARRDEETRRHETSGSVPGKAGVNKVYQTCAESVQQLPSPPSNQERWS